MTSSPFSARIEAARQRGDATAVRVLEAEQREYLRSYDAEQQARRFDATGKPIVPDDEINAMTAAQLVELQESDPGLYARSVAAAAASPPASDEGVSSPAGGGA